MELRASSLAQVEKASHKRFSHLLRGSQFSAVELVYWGEHREAELET